MTKSEKINLAATILGPMVVSGMIYWAHWSYEASLKIELDAQDKANAAAFVSKTWHQASIDGVNKRLDGHDASIGTLEKEVATVEGQLSVKTGRHGAQELGSGN